MQQKTRYTINTSRFNKPTLMWAGCWYLAMMNLAWAGGGGTGGGVRTVSVNAVPVGVLITTQLALCLWYVWAARK